MVVEVLCIDAMSSFSGGGAMQWAAKAVEVLCIDAMGSFSGGGAMQWALGSYGRNNLGLHTRQLYSI